MENNVKCEHGEQSATCAFCNMQSIIDDQSTVIKSAFDILKVAECPHADCADGVKRVFLAQKYLDMPCAWCKTRKSVIERIALIQ